VNLRLPFEIEYNDSCRQFALIVVLNLEFDEISVQCISSCSLSASLIVEELISPFSCCVLGDQCEMLPKFCKI